MAQTFDLTAHTLTVLITNNCTAECAHCCMNSAPGREGNLDFSQIRQTIDGLSDQQRLNVVVFAGGEPTLVKPALRASIEYCASKGILTRLVTNASWAISTAKARSILSEFREWGLHELNLSADDHHLPFIPIERIVHAYQASKGLGFTSVIIANSAGPNSLVTPEYLQELIGESLPLVYDVEESAASPRVSEGGTFYAIANSRLQKLARGRELLSDADFHTAGDDIDDIDMPCPFAARSVALSPGGHLMACCGFEAENNSVLDFGDTSQASIAELMKKANDDVILKAIALLGPFFLRKFIRRRDPSAAPPPAPNVCETCESIVCNEEAMEVLRSDIADLAAIVLRKQREISNPSDPKLRLGQRMGGKKKFGKRPKRGAGQVEALSLRESQID